ncbi:MAG: amidohydrolase family protein [Alphaproteobacteria bacterium]|nr:amidohydrolase family protein [Alphaproteobacteria bacterium]MCB9931415.1 amidohydrolase family protein [Alphaproteobacteria bacterium]
MAEKTSGANMGHTAPDDAWLAKLQEDILEPDLPIIDPHHHLWMRNGYRYLIPEFMEDAASGHNIVSTVFAECHSMYRPDGPEAERPLGETEFIVGCAAMAASGAFGPARACAAMFGRVEMTLGAAVRPLLERHLERSAGRFKGVRYSTGWDANERIPNVAPARHMLIDPAVVEAAGVLADMNLTLDVWLYHPQLADVAALADKLPNLAIVLNHVGSPILGGPYRDKGEEVFRDWQQGIADLGQRANVYCKLGALPIRMPGSTADRSLPPGSEEIAAAWGPWMRACIDAFGPARCMFESNFPVQKRWSSYQTTWNAFKRMAADASAAEKADLFAGAATRAYRLG